MISVFEVSKAKFELTRCAGTDTLSIVAPLEETVDTTDRELKAGLCRSGLGLARGLGGSLAGLRLARTLARHFEYLSGRGGCGRWERGLLGAASRVGAGWTFTAMNEQRAFI